MTTTRHLWYTRRGQEIRGPFPQGLVIRYILLGRIHMTDELSSDQVRWLPVVEIPDVIPDLMKADQNDPAVQEQLLIARRREDEREDGDRRQREGKIADAQRRKDDRRQDEAEVFTQHRALKTKLTKERKIQPERTRAPFFIALAVVLSGTVAAAFLYMPKPPAMRLQCDAPAGPQVNWNNCKFEGIILTSVDLAGATMTNANLTGAQLQNANLSASNLSYANFSQVNFSGSNLSKATLTGTVLRNANLEKATLSNAKLDYAILQGANLSNADLKNSDLANADLSSANLDGAKLDGAILVDAIWTDKHVCKAGSVGKCVQ